MKSLANIIRLWTGERETLANADARLLSLLKSWATHADNIWELEDFVNEKGEKK